MAEKASIQFKKNNHQICTSAHNDFITIWYKTDDIKLQMDHHIKQQNYEIFILH